MLPDSLGHQLIVETFQNQLMHFCLATLIIILSMATSLVTLGHICGWCGDVVVMLWSCCGRTWSGAMV